MKEERLLRIILAPHMSEKASVGAEKISQYIFKVASDANKLEIKLAVEQLFKTKVTKVRIVNVVAKSRRFGQIVGKKKGWKKAYVTLLEGQQIDFAGTTKV
jgi:large subunit ribosomal protein L23